MSDFYLVLKNRHVYYIKKKHVALSCYYSFITKKREVKSVFKRLQNIVHLKYSASYSLKRSI